MKAILVAGLLFGDEGKGTVVNWLATQNPDTSLVVRYGGGFQCAHTVMRDDGKKHTFSHFGSATFQGVPTYLSQYMVVRPDLLVEEGFKLQPLVNVPVSILMNVDERCIVATHYHQTKSKDNASWHKRGTCGMGIGVARKYAKDWPDDAIYIRDCYDSKTLERKLKLMKERLDPHSDINPSLIVQDLTHCINFVNVWGEGIWREKREKGTVIFEGHQGALLDKTYGYRPYVTSDSTTFSRAKRLLMTYHGPREYYGVMRTYMTRHGAGPFVTESEAMRDLPEPDNGDAPNHLQGEFRRGFMDFDEVERGIRILAEPSLKLAITHMDVMPRFYYNQWKQNYFTYTDSPYPDFPTIEYFTGRQISILGYGPKAKDYKWKPQLS